MQLTKRRGWISCRLGGDRVEISGIACAYLTGEIDIWHHAASSDPAPPAHPAPDARLEELYLAGAAWT